MAITRRKFTLEFRIEAVTRIMETPQSRSSKFPTL